MVLDRLIHLRLEGFPLPPVLLLSPLLFLPLYPPLFLPPPLLRQKPSRLQVLFVLQLSEQLFCAKGQLLVLLLLGLLVRRTGQDEP